MHMIKTLGLLALTGSVLAAPVADPQNRKVVYEYKTVTVARNGGYHQPTPPPQPPKAEEPKPVELKPVVSTPAPPPPAKPSQPPAQPSGGYSNPSPPPSSGGDDKGYMSVVKNWRSKMNLPELKQDAGLEANALKTCVDGNGVMTHWLGPGSKGQVLAPGKEDGFEKVFVGGWLCEIPSLPGLNGICSTMSEGWSYNGQTGHAELLKNPQYTKIGCAISKGIWACDLGY